MAKGHPIFAALYDPLIQTAEKHGLAALRQQIVSDAAGEVLEIGIGTGLNLPHYQPGAVTQLHALEPDPYMRSRAEARAQRLGLTATFLEGTAEQLPFEDGSLDTVVMTLVLCSVNDGKKAVAEVYRVLRPGGVLRFIEHVRGTEAWRTKLQDLLTPLWRRLAGGCHLNRRTLEIIQSAGFIIVEQQQVAVLGIPWVNPQVAGVVRRQ